MIFAHYTGCPGIHDEGSSLEMGTAELNSVIGVSVKVVRCKHCGFWEPVLEHFFETPASRREFLEQLLKEEIKILTLHRE